MKKVDSIVAYNEILNIFHGSKYETNAYFLEEDIKTLISENGLFFERFADNLLLFEYIKPFNFFKVYYYLKNLSFPLNIKTDTALVMEIPYRGLKNFPSTVVDYLNDSGFESHINRELLALNRPKLEDINIPNSEFTFSIVKDQRWSKTIMEAIKNAFDLYTGDIITIEEAINSIQNNQILGVFKDGDLAGFIKFYIKNKVSWIGHLIVLPEYKGIGIGKTLVSSYLRMQIGQGINNFQLWVVSDNNAAIKLYTNFGYKPTNKNSISLIKK